jgi:hypothetical protein
LLYSPIDLIIPNKVGLHIAWKKSTTEFWEFEALSGKVAVPYLIADLGKMTDNRYSLLLRTKESDSSFNLTYGVTFFDFSIVLGDRFLNSLSGCRRGKSAQVSGREGVMEYEYMRIGAWSGGC